MKMPGITYFLFHAGKDKADKEQGNMRMVF